MKLSLNGTAWIQSEQVETGITLFQGWMREELGTENVGQTSGWRLDGWFPQVNPCCWHSWLTTLSRIVHLISQSHITLDRPRPWGQRIARLCAASGDASSWSAHFHLQVSLFADWFAAAVIKPVVCMSASKRVWVPPPRHPAKSWLLERVHHVVCWIWIYFWPVLQSRLLGIEHVLCYRGMELKLDASQPDALFKLLDDSLRQGHTEKELLCLLLPCLCILFLQLSPYPISVVK